MIGFSGLLVKSAQQMVLTAQDLKQAGIDTPILVGGAALSRKFTDFKISPEYDGPVLYSKDAMDGLAVANALHSSKKDDFLAENQQRREKAIANAAIVATMEKPERKQAVVPAIADAPVKIPRDLSRHVLKNYDYDTVQPYINRQMLIGHHLGLKGKVAEMIKEGNEKAISLNNLVNDLVDFVKKDEEYGINAAYQFFPAQSEGNKVYIYNPDNHNEVLEEFDFPRQAVSPYLCLADFVKPVSSGEMDYAGFFVVTAGRGIRKWADKWKKEGDFLKSHAIQALALRNSRRLCRKNSSIDEGFGGH